METFVEFTQGRPWITTLLAMNVADIISGVLVAVNGKDVSSSASFGGLSRKLVMWVIVGVCYLLQRHIQGLPLGDVAVMAYVGVEGLSLTENSAALGLPVPKPIVAALRNARYQSTKQLKYGGTYIDSELVELTGKKIDQYSESINQQASVVEQTSPEVHSRTRTVVVERSKSDPSFGTVQDNDPNPC